MKRCFGADFSLEPPFFERTDKDRFLIGEGIKSANAVNMGVHSGLGKVCIMYNYTEVKTGLYSYDGSYDGSGGGDHSHDRLGERLFG